MNKKYDNKFIVLYFYDLILVFLSVIGTVNIFLLALKNFRPFTSLFLSAVIFFSFIYTLRNRFRISTTDKRFSLAPLVLILLALLIRVPPTLYLLGGQDQGTYVSISRQYELDNKLYMVDEFRKTLTTEQKVLYDRDGNYIMPSFEKWNRPDSEYTMRFYPAYPSYLSLSSSLRLPGKSRCL